MANAIGKRGGPMVTRKVWIVACGLLAAMSARADLFNDNFNSETAALGTVTGGAPLTQWNVFKGSIDVVSSGSFGIQCNGGVGNCVDMNGSTVQLGGISTKNTFSLASGLTYTLTWFMSGNQRVPGQIDTVDITFDGITKELALPWDSPMQQYSIVDTPAAASSSGISVESISGFNFQVGVILDDVRLVQSSVPEPSSVALMLPAAALLALRIRRSR
jgi:hypothetical protein